MLDTSIDELKVSIHARTWRAIEIRAEKPRLFVVSIHARTWRAIIRSSVESERITCFNPRPHVAGDRTTKISRSLVTCFNPRPHVAGDRLPDCEDASQVRVSIHARTWRAITLLSRSRFSSTVSIHARTWRAITHPLQGLGDHRRFNPRPHVAGDGLPQPSPHTGAMFQSTPARGGRLPALSSRSSSPIEFQSTPARGGRSGSERPRKAVSGFNPRPHVAGDFGAGKQGARGMCFNPRPHVAGDDPVTGGVVLLSLFQSTPARGGR